LAELSGWRKSVAAICLAIIVAACLVATVIVCAWLTGHLATPVDSDVYGFTIRGVGAVLASDGHEIVWASAGFAGIVTAAGIATLVVLALVAPGQPARRKPGLGWCVVAGGIAVPWRVRNLVRRADGSVPVAVTAWQVLTVVSLAPIRFGPLHVPMEGRWSHYTALVGLIGTLVLVVVVLVRPAPWRADRLPPLVPPEPPTSAEVMRVA
jgi:hypothetical protein